MMHGSYANYSDKPRRAVVLNAMADTTMGCTANYERMEALRNFPVMKQDRILDGQYFPLLFNGEKELGSIYNKIPRVNSAKLYSLR